MKFCNRKIEPNYSEEYQITQRDFDGKNGTYGKHMVFWGKNREEVERLCGNLPEILNYFFEKTENEQQILLDEQSFARIV